MTTNNNIKPNNFNNLQYSVKPPAKSLKTHYSKKPNENKDLHTIVEVYYNPLYTIEKIHYSIKVNAVKRLYTIVEVELYSITSCEH